MNGPQTITKTKTRTKTIIGWALVGGAIVAAAGALFTGKDQPELLIQNIGFPSIVKPAVGTAMRFYGAIQNRGSGEASASQASLRLDVGNDGTWDVTPASISIPQIVAGSPTSSWQPASWENVWTATAGTHQFEICADAENTVNEISEANNCASYIFTVEGEIPETPILPNLTLWILKLEGTHYLAGDVLSLKGSTKNHGTTPASQVVPLDSRLRLDIGNDGTWDTELTTTFSYPMTSGTAQNISFSNAWTASVGTHKFEICADYQNTIAEYNESDNCAAMIFTVGEAPQAAEVTTTSEGTAVPPPPPPPPPQPASQADLIVESVTFDNNRVPTAVIKNQGSADSTETTVRFYWIGSNGPGEFFTDQEASVRALAANATAALVPAGNRTTPAGAASLQVIVDELNSVSESNEYNNSLTVLVPAVTQADLIVESVTWMGQGYAQVKVKNQGVGAAGTFKVRRERLKADGTAVSSGVTTISGLAPGASYQFSPLALNRPEQKSLRVTVDADNQVAEADENNNTVTSPKP